VTRVTRGWDFSFYFIRPSSISSKRKGMGTLCSRGHKSQWSGNWNISSELMILGRERMSCARGLAIHATTFENRISSLSFKPLELTLILFSSYFYFVGLSICRSMDWSARDGLKRAFCNFQFFRWTNKGYYIKRIEIPSIHEISWCQ
jgi:hypothetical protein